jgi:hypothetical protein
LPFGFTGIIGNPDANNLKFQGVPDFTVGGTTRRRVDPE